MVLEQSRLVGRHQGGTLCRAAAGDGGVRKEAGMFFFEKKNQKTFAI
jgi:hypothetical protein